MSNFKLIVDILASLASLVAILTVLGSWWHSRLPPLIVSQMVISRIGSKHRVFVRLQNRRQYPVKILSLDCYRDMKFNVRGNKNEKPTLFPSVNVGDKVLSYKELDIVEFGESILNIETSVENLDIDKFHFSVRTLHGRMDLVCNNVVYFEKQITTVDPSADYYTENRFVAYVLYARKYVGYWFQKIKSKVIGEGF
ncbi:hypothetical protein ACJO1Y_23260 [Vibrio parahaemolyticus]|uniref:hypothetical protein n=1 Tax=Vibrio parahaemolyticus TaxID=670 RepID=UPI001A343062|nr:hypothetical protein [Vibrio vulnificus]HDY7626515.1 hypothetical protein [Vibrio vulnificus]HEB2783921.1 hypothetical protein [Vibrio vulnificus]